MCNFQNIIGHEQNIEHLEKAIAEGMVSHAYIFNGEEGIGKMTVAKAFAKALLCEQKNSCGHCQSCIQIDSMNHPDVIYVTHEKSVITVDDIRDQVNHTIAVKPYSSEYKIYIIDEADKMNVMAQNALLKTIEEPPEYAVIILLADNKDTFLETIRSRCIQLNFGPLKEEQVRDYIRKHYGENNSKEDLAAAYSMGNIGKAIKVMESQEFEEMKLYAKQLCKNSPFLRVDFYVINHVVYFGELTFFHNSGLMHIQQYEWDQKLGDMLRL